MGGQHAGVRGGRGVGIGSEVQLCVARKYLNVAASNRGIERACAGQAGEEARRGGAWLQLALRGALTAASPAPHPPLSALPSP